MLASPLFACIRKRRVLWRQWKKRFYCVNYLKDEGGWDSTILYREECVILMMLEVISFISTAAVIPHPASTGTPLFSSGTRQYKVFFFFFYQTQRGILWDLKQVHGQDCCSKLFVATTVMSTFSSNRCLTPHLWSWILKCVWVVNTGWRRKCFRPVQHREDPEANQRRVFMERMVGISFIMSSTAPGSYGVW